MDATIFSSFNLKPKLIMQLLCAPRERAPSTHWTVGCVGPRVSLDDEEIKVWGGAIPVADLGRP
jgi:hypothetical protein